MVPLSESIDTIGWRKSLRNARVAVTTRAADFRNDGPGARALVAGALGIDATRIARAEQVHGPRVVALDAMPDKTVPDADGLATRERGLAIVALGADCPGVAIVADEIPAVAVAHAGWRGAVADVAPNAVEQLARWGARRSTLEAWIGPGIGPCCFEVGDEVVATFESAHGPLGGLVTRGPAGKPHIDLKGAIARRLVDKGGLPPENVHVIPDCTRCAPGRPYFSRRGEGASCGHHAIVAWLAT